MCVCVRARTRACLRAFTHQQDSDDNVEEHDGADQNVRNEEEGHAWIRVAVRVIPEHCARNRAALIASIMVCSGGTQWIGPRTFEWKLTECAAYTWKLF